MRKKIFENIVHLIILTFFIVPITSCSKDWLDVKSNKKLVVPSTIKDFQAILDKDTYINSGSFGLQAIAETSSDNFYLSFANWNVQVARNKNAYAFQKDIFEGGTNVPIWEYPFKRVFYANVALDGLKEIPPNASEQNNWNNAMGSGLFIRAHSFFWLAQIYAKQYDKSTAANDLGIPLRLNSDPNEVSSRSTVKETYERILKDLHEAVNLLPTSSPYKIRPTKPAVFALLARTYLSMEEYSEAIKYADSCLKIYSVLLDYNNINSTITFPIPQYNDEVIYSDISPASIFHPSFGRIDSVLYASYDVNDLRKKIFFKSNSTWYSFNGSYNGDFQLFGGIAVDEVLLMRAECYARNGNITDAMTDLNTLMKKRWNNKVSYPTITAANAEDALKIVLNERRKELCFRGLRWMDLRRLNKNPNYATKLVRILNNITYELPANDPRYVFPIPDDVIAITGMKQNER